MDNNTTTSSSSASDTANAIPPIGQALASLPPSDPVINLTIPIPTKLNQTNYLTWKSQILPIVNGHNLSRFFHSPPPPPTVHNTSGQVVLNPEYLPWNRQDQLLLGWLRSSLSEVIQAHVLSSNTSASLWLSLDTMFASTSRARMLDLKRQLQTTNKGSRSYSDFLLSIRRVADELAFVGASVSDNDLTLAVLNGLGPEFNSFVAAITATGRRDPLTFTDIHGLLLSHEALIQHQLATMVPSPSSSFPTTFAAFQQTGGVCSNSFQFKNKPRHGTYQQHRPTHTSTSLTLISLVFNQDLHLDSMLLVQTLMLFDLVIELPVRFARSQVTQPRLVIGGTSLT